MDFNFGVSRPLTRQVTLSRSIPVPKGRAVPLSEEFTAESLITCWMLQNPSHNHKPVYLTQGRIESNDPRELTTPYIEVLPGACPVFTAFQEGRQLYELQILVMKLTTQTAGDLIKVPLIVWDLTEWWLLGHPEQDDTVHVTLVAFPLPYA